MSLSTAALVLLFPLHHKEAKITSQHMSNSIRPPSAAGCQLVFCVFHHKFSCSGFFIILLFPLQSTTSPCLRSRGKGERILGDTAFPLAFRITVTVSNDNRNVSFFALV